MTTGDRVGWRALAACADRPAHWFAPETLGDLLRGQLVCRTCPVTGRDGPCYRSASEADLFWTIRGGQEPGLFPQRRMAQDRRTERNRVGRTGPGQQTIEFQEATG